MVKNRYFHSLAGIKFGLAIGKTGTSPATTLAATNGAVYDISMFQHTGGKYPVGLTWGSPIPDKKLPVFIGYVNAKNGNNTAELINTVSFVPDRTTAKLTAYKAPANQVTTSAVGSTVPTNGQLLVVKVVETTPQSIPLPTWDYEAVIAGGTVASAVAAIVTQINGAKQGEFFTAAASSTTGITITSNEAIRSFKLIVYAQPTRVAPADTGATFTANTTTKPYAGNGTLAQVLELVKEHNVLRGVTTNYPMNGSAAEYGMPVDTTTGAATANWDIVVLAPNQQEDSPTPVNTHHKKEYIYVAMPAGSGAALVAMFGLYTPTV